MSTYDLTQSQVEELATQVYEDYWSATDPFTNEMMPEHLVSSGFDTDREYSLFLTLVVSIDKRKETMGEHGLWKEAKRLWNEEETHWIYEPRQVVEEHDYEDLIDLFTSPDLKQFNYYEDPHVWYLNSLSLYRYFDSNPIEMLKAVDYSAPELLELVNNEQYKSRFHSIGGKKVGPLWVRLLDEEIHELNQIHDIEIPVDSRIQNLTNTFLGTDKTKAQVRNFWREVCNEADLVPVRLDQPLWLIDKFLVDGDQYISEGCQRFQNYLDERVANVS